MYCKAPLYLFCKIILSMISKCTTMKRYTSHCTYNIESLMSNMHDTVNQLLFTINLSLNLPVTSWFAATYFCDQGFRMESTYKRYFEK